MASGRGRQRERAGEAGASATVAVVVIALVVIAIAVMVLLSRSNESAKPSPGASAGSSAKPSATPTGPVLSDAVMQDVVGVPAAVLDAAGAGGNDVRPPDKLPADTPALTSDGKPEAFYVGAGFCPFCAAERWPLVQALSRFGEFSNLGPSVSGPAPEVYPNTHTVTFYGSSYTSPYVAFAPVEMADTAGNPLQQLTPEQQRVFDTYNAPPYAPKGSAGAIPFLDIGGVYVGAGASFGVELLQGMSIEEIAASMSDPSSRAGQSIDASANLLTAAICETTGNQPADVCSTPAVKVAAQRLATGS